jgi:hypothetical protein
MRRHVVGPLVVVAVEAHILRHDPVQEGVEIVADVGRRIFLDQERGRGVLDVGGKQTRREVLAFDPAGDLGGNLFDLARLGIDQEAVLSDAHRD